jgi:hypothetical protein
MDVIIMEDSEKEQEQFSVVCSFKLTFYYSLEFIAFSTSSNNKQHARLTQLVQ